MIFINPTLEYVPSICKHYTVYITHIIFSVMSAVRRGSFLDHCQATNSMRSLTGRMKYISSSPTVYCWPLALLWYILHLLYPAALTYLHTHLQKETWLLFWRDTDLQDTLMERICKLFTYVSKVHVHLRHDNRQYNITNLLTDRWGQFKYYVHGMCKWSDIPIVCAHEVIYR